MLVSAAGARVRVLAAFDQAPAGRCLLLPRSRHEAPNDRARLHAAAAWCEAEVESRCLILFATSTCMESACCHNQAPAPAGPGGLPWHRSCHEAPNDRASLRLLHDARWRWSQVARFSLPLALGWRVHAAATRHLQNLGVCLRTGDPEPA